VEWLSGGRGRYLESLTSILSGGSAYELVHEALRQGRLPLLKRVDASLPNPRQRALLTEGFVAAMGELRVHVGCRRNAAEIEPQLAALGLVRQLPVLAKLEISLHVPAGISADWPPFVPPSLKGLRIELLDAPGLPAAGRRPAHEPFLHALPGILGASGASLERLEVIIPSSFDAIGDGLLHLAQAVRCCSPTLKGILVKNASDYGLLVDKEAQDYASQVERLRVQWADVMAAVSACRELKVLALPHIEVGPWFLRGTAFNRLTHLEISDNEREHPPAAGVMGLWELMASGGLPALTKLSVRLEGRWGGAEEVRTWVAPAFEAVAGTLTHLYINKVDHDGEWLSDEVEVGYELGIAVGKLRRLKDLVLRLSGDGRVYQAMAQGLAASGGDRPLPLLWRLGFFALQVNAHLVVASLQLPSVRVLLSSQDTRRESLVMACALRQVGYKHIFVPCGFVGKDRMSLLRAITAPCCTLSEALLQVDTDWYFVRALSDSL
jgi:hypothetical protein